MLLKVLICIYFIVILAHKQNNKGLGIHEGVFTCMLTFFFFLMQDNKFSSKLE